MNAPNSRPPWIAISIVVALVILGANVAGYLVFRDRPEPAPAPAAPATTEPKAAADAPAPTSRGQLAVEQREQGIAKLREGAYARARIHFENAQQLDPKVADIEDLLQLADRLSQTDDAEAVARRAPEPRPAPPPTRRTSPRPRRSRAVVKRSEPERSAPKPASKGRLLVVTDPDQLLIEVDGRPSALSPTELDLGPGEHRIVVRRGRAILESRTVSLAAGGTETLELDLRRQIAALSPAPRKAPATREGGDIGRDEQLDLLDLVGRDDVKPTAAARSAGTAGTAETAPTAPAPAAGRPKLFVVWPGATRRDLSRALGSSLSGVPVRVVSSPSDVDLDAGPLAVMGRPATLRSAGLSASWRAAARTPEQYVAASLKPIGKTDVLSRPLGIADKSAGRRASLFVGRLLGTDAPPKVRRVNSVEDLMSMLQLSVVDIVLLPQGDLSRLQGRTQQKLHTLELTASQPELAVAFVGDDRAARASLESALESISADTQRALGMRSWIR